MSFLTNLIKFGVVRSPGRAFNNSGYGEFLVVSLSFTAVPVGAGVAPCPLGARRDLHSRVDVGADVINMPALVIAGDTFIIEAFVDFSATPPLAVGTNLELVIERLRISDGQISSFLNFTGIYNNAIIGTLINGSRVGILDRTIYDKLRVKIFHDDPVNNTFVVGNVSLLIRQLPT